MTITPSDEDREKVQDLLKELAVCFHCVKYDHERCIADACGNRAILQTALADAKAAEREKWWKAGDEAGWRRALERAAIWLEIKAKALMESGGDTDAIGTAIVRQHMSDARFIRGQQYEPSIEPLPTPGQGEKP